jgi:apolipoprotein N-acyltransferase
MITDRPAWLPHLRTPTALPTAGPGARPRPFLAALLSAGLLWASYFPLAFGALAWVALVPLLTLVRSPARPRSVYLAAWLGGLALYLPVMQWIRVADPNMYYAWIGLALYCSFYFPLIVALLRRLDRTTRLPLAVTVPLVWTPLEYFRARFGSGYPWYFLGHTQHAFLPVIQVSDLTGAYGVTFLVAAVNGLLFDWLAGRSAAFRRIAGLPEPEPRPRRGLLGATLAVTLLVGAALAYGGWRLGQDRFADGPRVALLQGNVPQQLKEAGGTDLTIHFRDLCDRASEAQPPPDLIVWPETTYPIDWVEPTDPALIARAGRDEWWTSHIDYSRQLPGQAVHRWGTSVLLGLNARSLTPTDGGRGVLMNRYNSALLIEPPGRAVARYDKVHRVPFGEYVPLQTLLPWLQKFTPYEEEYSVTPGEGPTRFPLHTARGNYQFGVVICYEDSDPYLARQYVRPAEETGRPKVDFLVNTSNDGWFDGTAEHEEHLAICRFRAVECRRAVARAVNMGISAVIDANGRVVALPAATWAGSKKVAAVVSAVIPIDTRPSLYAAWGDWLPSLCAALAGLALLGGVVANRRRQPTSNTPPGG